MRRLFKNLLFFTFLFLPCFAFANSKQNSQVIKTGHWLYEDLTLLATDCGSTMILETQPMTIGEINFFLNELDLNKLSPSGTKVYKRVMEFIEDEQDYVKAEEFRFFINFKLNPEFYYKSNKDIDWSFMSFYKDYAVTFPIIMGYSDCLTIQSDFYIGKNAYGISLPSNYTNIPLKTKEINFYFPDFSYFAFNKTFNKWGITAQLGRTGMKIGNPKTHSIIYNNTFETDFYTQLNLYCKYLKYAMNVTQIDNTKYIYIHQLTFRPIHNLNLGILEGSLLNAPFELRYLNPFMAMHSFGSWRQYNELDRMRYGESNFCAYLGLTVDFIPIQNLRIYGLYAQNEMFDPGASFTPSNLSMPDSLGAQVGIEYNIPLKNYAHLKTNVEALYTSPYFYVKQSPAWSMYRSRDDVHSHTDFKTWIGVPQGPDCFSISGSLKYDSNDNWSIGGGYNFTMHGENRMDNLFNPKNIYELKDEKGNVIDRYWNYYPNVQFRHTDPTNTAEINRIVRNARDMWMIGIPEYKHQIIINGEYKNLFKYIDLSAQMIYTLVQNNKNIKNNFAHGVELSMALSYEFK